MQVFSTYIPRDRRQALAEGVELADRTSGGALFADISGFTPLTEALARSLGPRRGAEELTVHLNLVYQSLIEEVDRYGGSVIAFAGDAITCWFQNDTGSAATQCALAMQTTMAQFGNVRVADGKVVELALKVGVAQGPTRRFVVGRPEIQVLDVLAGQTLGRMAAAANAAERGEVILEDKLAHSLGDNLELKSWKTDKYGTPFAVAQSLRNAVKPTAQSKPLDLSDARVRPWLMAPVYQRLKAGQGEFLTELRPAVAMFLKFDGIDYDGDDEAGVKLSAYVNWVQEVLHSYEGFLVDVAIGDKGSYLYSCFGAPIAHENDVWRAITVARKLIKPPAEFSFLTLTQIGVSTGTMRTGAYGGSTRRTYGVLGDQVNMAARLMEHAKPGQVLVADRVRHAAGNAFVWQPLSPVKAKGKSEPVPVHVLLSMADHGRSRLLEPQYALPMVGREQELGVIRTALEAARLGRGQIVSITAEAGMGKSRLAAEAIRLAQGSGLKTCAGQCQSHGTNTSYLAWQTIWQALFELPQEAPEAVQIAALEQKLDQIDPLLTSRLPLLANAVDLPIPDNNVTLSLEPRLRKASLEALLCDCLRKLTKGNPTLLVMEDLHWVDALSHELLDVLARAIAQSPVLFVLTQRRQDTGVPQQSAYRQLPYFAEVTLSALDGVEAGRLVSLKVDQLFPQQRPPPQLLERLVVRSAGNPFYLEELLNLLKDQRIDFTNPEAVKSLDLPVSLQSLVLSRIDRLTETQQAALKVACVIGRLFPAAAVWGIQTHQDREQVSADLARICAVDLTAIDRPEPELFYIFKHVVTQEVTYESLPHRTRAKLHEEIGLQLEKLYRDRIEQQLNLLAFHFDRSENKEKKRDYLKRAGEAAQAHYANAAAVNYYERVMGLLEPAEQIVTFLQLGKVRELIGEWKKAGACYQQAFQIAEQLRDRQAQARCQAATGDLLRKQGLFNEARDWLGIARTQFEDIGDNSGVAQTLQGAGTVAAMQGDYATAWSLYERSLELRRKLGDKAHIANLLNNLGLIARFKGDYAASLKLNEQSLEIRRQLGDRWGIANSLNNMGILLRDMNRSAEARDQLEESLLLNREVGDRWAVANVLTSLGEVVVDLQDWEAAKGFLNESLSMNLELGDRTAVAFIIEGFAAMASGQARAAHAVRLAAAAAALRSEIGSPLSPSEQARLNRFIDVALQSLTSEQQAICLAEGSALKFDQAVAAASQNELTPGWTADGSSVNCT